MERSSSHQLCRRKNNFRDPISRDRGGLWAKLQRSLPNLALWPHRLSGPDPLSKRANRILQDLRLRFAARPWRLKWSLPLDGRPWSGGKMPGLRATKRLLWKILLRLRRHPSRLLLNLPSFLGGLFKFQYNLSS